MIHRSPCFIRRFFWLLILSFAIHAQAALPPGMVFRPQALAIDGQTVDIAFQINEGYYLYRDKFQFSIEAENAQLGAPIFPQGRMVDDENFGKVEVYHQQVVIRLPVLRARAGVLPLTLNIVSQGCAEAGLCYPPQTHRFTLDLPDAPVSASTATTPTSAPISKATSPAPTAINADEAGRITQLLQDSHFAWVLVSFFGFGLLLSLTPCVFPMIPIISSILVKQSHATQGLSHKRGFSLALVYVLGMAITYTLLGVMAGFTGTLLQSLMQTTWFLVSMAVIFVALALSMFGYYEIQLPAFLQHRLAARSASRGWVAIAAMGAFSTVLAGACVVAPLAGALLYIGQTGDALLGGLALFCMAFGMGVPLLLIGLSAGKLLPKSGAWMSSVKKIVGFLLLGMAISTVSPVTSDIVVMLLWTLLLIVTAIYLRAIDPLPPEATAWPRLAKGVGVIFLLAGVAMLVGALSGATDPLQPLAALEQGAQKNKERRLNFQAIRSLAELDERLKSTTQPVMLDFYADACQACKQLDKYTFTDPRVQKKLANWLLLHVDVTANSADDKALLARFNLYGTPGIVFFNKDGEEINNVRVIGFQSANEFLKTLSALPLE